MIRACAEIVMGKLFVHIVHLEARTGKIGKEFVY